MLMMEPRATSVAVPLTIAGLAAWFDASDLSTLFQNSTLATPVAANSDPVGGWKDKSGNNNHALQATDAKRPLYKTGVLNSQAGILSDGSDDCLQVSGLSLSTHTMFVVFKASGDGAIMEHGDNANTNDGFYIAPSNGNTSTIQRSITAGGGVSSAKLAADWATDNVARRVRVENGGTAALHKLYIAGTLQSWASETATSLSASAATSATLNIFSRNNGSGFLFTGHIFELLIYSPVISAPSAAIVEAYLGTKWRV